MGGSGSVGEDQDVVQIIMLKSVKSTSSTSLQVDYYFVDPFGTLGMVYLELHEAQTLADQDLTLSEIYDQTYDGTYWDTFPDSRRVSVSTYDTTYTFTGLTPGTSYYVVMGHIGEDADTGDVVRTLDDYFKVMTSVQKNSLTIDRLTSTTVTVTFSLESLSACTSTATLQLNDGDIIELTESDIKKAVESSCTKTFTGVNVADLGSKITVSLIDENESVVRTAVADNAFADAEEETDTGTGSGTVTGTGTGSGTVTGTGTGTGTVTGTENTDEASGGDAASLEDGVVTAYESSDEEDLEDGGDEDEGDK